MTWTLFVQQDGVGTLSDVVIEELKEPLEQRLQRQALFSVEWVLRLRQPWQEKEAST